MGEAQKFSIHLFVVVSADARVQTNMNLHFIVIVSVSASQNCPSDCRLNENEKPIYRLTKCQLAN